MTVPPCFDLLRVGAWFASWYAVRAGLSTAARARNATRSDTANRYSQSPDHSRMKHHTAPNPYPNPPPAGQYAVARAAVTDWKRPRARTAAASSPALARGVDHPEVDLVVVVTPDRLHQEPARTAAAGGQALVLRQADRRRRRRGLPHLVRLPRPRPAYVPYWTRYEPKFRRAQELAAGGALGEIKVVVYRWHNPRPPTMPFTWRDDAARGHGAPLRDGSRVIGHLGAARAPAASQRYQLDADREHANGNAAAEILARRSVRRKARGGRGWRRRCRATLLSPNMVAWHARRPAVERAITSVKLNTAEPAA